MRFVVQRKMSFYPKDQSWQMDWGQKERGIGAGAQAPARGWLGR